MTANEIDNEFLTIYDRVSATSAPSLDEYERSVILTKAQENVIKRKVHHMGNKYGEGFDMTEKRMADINDVIKYDTPSTSGSQTGTTPNGVIYDLPADFWLAIREDAVINKNNCLTGNPINADVKTVTNAFVGANINNPFRKPFYNDYEATVWRLRIGKSGSASRHELITDGTFDVNTYKLWYIKQLSPIIVSTLTVDFPSIAGQRTETAPDFSDSVCREIIDEAVRIATVVTNPAEIQIRSSEINLNE